MSDKAERLLEQALSLDPDERIAFIRAETYGDVALRDELESLVNEAASADQFFDQLDNAVFSTPITVDDGVPLTGFLRDAQLREGDMAGHYRIIAIAGVLEEVGHRQRRTAVEEVNVDGAESGHDAHDAAGDVGVGEERGEVDRLVRGRTQVDVVDRAGRRVIGGRDLDADRLGAADGDPADEHLHAERALRAVNVGARPPD